MLTKDIWTELSPKWPRAFWDDWMREPMQRRGRACIRPEIPRTRTFGRIGVSNGQFFDEHLQHIMLNQKPVDFTKMDLTHLLKQNYDKPFLQHVYSRPAVTIDDIRRNSVPTRDPVRIQYNGEHQFESLARQLGLMDDFKSGVPRTGYMGIVTTFYNKQRIFLAPNANWELI